MDSNRSGLLSTLLMTLPLIVVPALALLRPPNAPPTVSAQPLAADTQAPDDADDLGFPDDFAGTPAKNQLTANKDDLDIDAIFGPRQSENSPAQPSADSPKPTTSEKSSTDPFQTDSAPPQTKPLPTPKSEPSSSTTGNTDSTQRLLQQLNALGCIRTLWFDAGDQSPVGFAAFFRGETELTVYRFEATGQSRAQCVQDVLQQVTDWRRMAATN
ncbi:MAG: hypothetical protein RLZZ458_593 [Planctomycetota bacterium]|jgi:hypothetical protein